MPGAFSDARLQQAVEQFVQALVNWNSGAEPAVNWNSGAKPLVNWNSGAGPAVNWNSGVAPVAELNLSLILDSDGQWHMVKIEKIGSLIQASEAVQQMMTDVETEFLIGGVS